MRSRLTKAERHAWRQAVRRSMLVTTQDILEMQPAESRVVLAELRKRRWRRDWMRDVWRPPLTGDAREVIAEFDRREKTVAHTIEKIRKYRGGRSTGAAVGWLIEALVNGRKPRLLG